MTNIQRGILGSRVTPYTIAITFDDGKPVSITTDNPNFQRIAAKLKAGDYRDLWTLCNPAEGIKAYFGGLVQIKNGTIFANGEAIHHAIVPTILEMIRNGENAEPLLRFLLLLQGNPSMNSRNQLWDFISKNKVVVYEGGPVTVRDAKTGRTSLLDAKGYLVLYKGVNNNYTDCHTGKFLNKPGLQLEMPRPKVDDNQNRGCSSGFHAGAFEYVRNFGQRKLIVLVNPADVVSVPNDCSFQKLRTCRYTVLKEVEASAFAEIVGTNYKDDGRSTFKVVFEDTDSFDDQETTVRAIDAAHAIELVEEEYDVDVIKSVVIVA